MRLWMVFLLTSCGVLGFLASCSSGDGKDIRPIETAAQSGQELAAEFCTTLSDLDSRTPVGHNPEPPATDADYSRLHDALKAHVRSSYKATYEACRKGTRKFTGSLVWTKEFLRVRFDLNGFERTEPVSTSYFGPQSGPEDEHQSVTCSSELGAYFTARFRANMAVVKKGSLMEDLAELGSACASAKVLANLMTDDILRRFDLLDVRSTSPDAFEDVDPRTIAIVFSVEERVVAGRQSTCFVVEHLKDEVGEQCYDSGGILTYSRVDSRDGVAVLRLSGDVEGPDESDFELPHKLTRFD